MRMSMFKKHKRAWILGGVGLFVLIFSVFFLPYTPAYRSSVHFLWSTGQIGVSYYLNVSDAALARRLGEYYFGNGAYDLSKAKQSYELAIKLDPKTYLGHYQLSRIYFVQGDMEGAMREIDAEIAINKGNFRALYARGLVHLTRNDLTSSEADFRNFIPWAPTEWGGYNDLAFVLSKAGKHAEAEQTIHTAMESVPHAEEVPWLWNSLGLAELNQGKYKEAAVSFGKALPLAQKVTPKEWVRAYSANDPAAVRASIDAFNAAIEKNLAVAESKSI